MGICGNNFSLITNHTKLSFTHFLTNMKEDLLQSNSKNRSHFCMPLYSRNGNWSLVSSDQAMQHGKACNLGHIYAGPIDKSVESSLTIFNSNYKQNKKITIAFDSSNITSTVTILPTKNNLKLITIHRQQQFHHQHFVKSKKKSDYFQKEIRRIDEETY